MLLSSLLLVEEELSSLPGSLQPSRRLEALGSALIQRRSPVTDAITVTPADVLNPQSVSGL
jgi:hypothetical protein